MEKPTEKIFDNKIRVKRFIRAHMDKKWNE